MVSNMDTAIHFYTEILGLKLKSRYGDHWADIEAPGMSIGLHPAAKAMKTGDNLSIGFSIKDLDEAAALLKQAGVPVQLKDDGQVNLAMFTDPDGNALYLAQSKW
jgi:catechol 2,3-dioxygenase-like lactoylglutathione lyase family enzyme